MARYDDARRSLHQLEDALWDAETDYEDEESDEEDWDEEEYEEYEEDEDWE